MTRKSKGFLGAACVMWAVALMPAFGAALVSLDVADFATGLAVAFLVGALVTWKRQPSPRA